MSASLARVAQPPSAVARTSFPKNQRLASPNSSAPEAQREVGPGGRAALQRREKMIEKASFLAACGPRAASGARNNLCAGSTTQARIAFPRPTEGSDTAASCLVADFYGLTFSRQQRESESSADKTAVSSSTYMLRWPLERYLHGILNVRVSV